MFDLRAGTRVEITRDGKPTIIGRVESIDTPDELEQSSLYTRDEHDEHRVSVAHRMRELGVSRLVIITYLAAIHEWHMILAVEANGQWRDWSGCPMQMEVVGQHGSCRPELN